MDSVYDFTVRERGGEPPLSLESYRGKALLIVNTATHCGFTPQYEGLQRLYSQYGQKGFEILDFPCNQFANQAPETAEEIYGICTGRFGITFRQFDKVEVNGANEEPLFAFLKDKLKGSFGKRIKWNFTKFLVDREGVPVKRFAPSDKPEKIERYLLPLLKS